MDDAQLAALFDGRPRVELVLTGWSIGQADRAAWIGDAYGYALQESGPFGRGQHRLVFTRDDGPLARRRAQAARPPTVSPHGSPQTIHPLHAARARRNVLAYEDWSPALLIALSALVGAALTALAWAARDTWPLAAIACGGAALCLVAALAGPRCTRAWHRKNVQVLEEFRRQQAAGWGVAPPAPPPPPRGSQHSHEKDQ